MLQNVVCRAVQLLTHRRPGVQLLMLQLLVLELLALHRHRGEGKSHGLQDRGADLVHAGLADSADPADPQGLNCQEFDWKTTYDEKVFIDQNEAEELLATLEQLAGKLAQDTQPLPLGKMLFLLNIFCC